MCEYNTISFFAVIFITKVYVIMASNCGLTPIKPSIPPRIRGSEEIVGVVGGQKAIPYSWPWQAAFCQNAFWSCSIFCGATLISNEWLMTAGHCVYGNIDRPQNFRIKLGVYDEENENENGEIVANIKKMVLHPQYNHATTSHDIGLLQLAEPIEFTDHIQPVCIPSSDGEYLNPGKDVIVTGWGDTKEGGHISPELRQVSVPILSYTECNSDYNGQVEEDVMFCAGIEGKDSCQGDSGGPAVEILGDGRRWAQFGIISWGHGCAEEGLPGVYSRVSAYADWIKQITGVEPFGV